MKYIHIFTLMFSLLVAACAGSGNKQADGDVTMPPMQIPHRQGWHRELPALNGDIERVTVTQYFAGTSGEEMRETYKFNLRGDVVEKVEYSGRTPWNTCRYTYDSEGRMAEKSWFKSDNSLDWSAYYTYHTDKGFIDEKCLNGNGEIRSISLRRYNTSWRVVDEANYDGEMVLQSTIFYQYDNSGKLTEEAGYFATGVLEYKYLYDYDVKGRLAKMTECDLDNRPMRSITYCYDAEGRVSEEIVCDDNNLESRWLYHYDTNGNVVKIEPSDNKNIVTKFEIVYRKLADR